MSVLTEQRLNYRLLEPLMGGNLPHLPTDPQPKAHQQPAGVASSYMCVYIWPRRLQLRPQTRPVTRESLPFLAPLFRLACQQASCAPKRLGIVGTSRPQQLFKETESELGHEALRGLSGSV